MSLYELEFPNAVFIVFLNQAKSQKCEYTYISFHRSIRIFSYFKLMTEQPVENCVVLKFTIGFKLFKNVFRIFLVLVKRINSMFAGKLFLDLLLILSPGKLQNCSS
jgi:hypothetical protein